MAPVLESRAELPESTACSLHSLSLSLPFQTGWMDNPTASRGFCALIERRAVTGRRAGPGVVLIER